MRRFSLTPKNLFLLAAIILVTRYLYVLFQEDTWRNSWSALRNKWQHSPICDPLSSWPRGDLNQTHSIYGDIDPHNSTEPAADSHGEQPAQEKDEVPERANAAFVFLARNSELRAVLKSLQQMEDRFNRRFKYPYVFLNDEPFTDEFKELTSNLISSNAQYGLISREHWHQPDWIDEQKAKAAREQMVESNIIYGGSVSYRNMCRFNSGFFFKHELMLPYRWYWRIEPGVEFYCDVLDDPFMSMQHWDQKYGFTISMYEFEETIPSLWKTTKEFVKKHPQYVAKGNAMEFVSNDGGNTYNLCHFWSNFEIADMEFFRGEAYTAYFNWLESQGGFYYERWGDAPVHSIAAALFLKKEQIRFFDEIGYRHENIQHCPSGETHKNGRCSCHPNSSFDWEYYSCLWDFSRIFE